MKYSNLIILISSLIITSTSVYASGYGGAIQNTESGQILYLECTAEDLSSEDECTEFQIVTSDLNGANKNRQKEFSLQEYSKEDIITILEDQFKYSINRNTDNSWFNSSGIIFDGIGYVGEGVAEVAPITTIVIAVILAIPTLIIVPTIGLTADLLKSPVVAIKDAVLKGNAAQKAREIFEHLLDRNTVEVMELEIDYFYDFHKSIMYRLK